MTDPIVAPATPVAPADLSGQIAGEVKVATSTAPTDKVAPEKPVDEVENKPDSQGAKDGDNEKPVDGGGDGTAVPDKPTPQEDGIKLGNTTYATPDAAIEEANRIIGRNAQLAGTNKDLTDKVTELNTTLQEALEANKEWEQWAKDNADGKAVPVPGSDPESIARRTAQIIAETQEGAKTRTVVEAEFTEVQGLSNFPKVAEAFMRIVNNNIHDPLTGKPFNSPKRLYGYLAKEYDLENEITKKSVVPPKTPPVAPKPPAGAKDAAARPTGTGGGTQKTPRKSPDEFDNAISRGGRGF